MLPNVLRLSYFDGFWLVGWLGVCLWFFTQHNIDKLKHKVFLSSFPSQALSLPALIMIEYNLNKISIMHIICIFRHSNVKGLLFHLYILILIVSSCFLWLLVVLQTYHVEFIHIFPTCISTFMPQVCTFTLRSEHKLSVY